MHSLPSPIYLCMHLRTGSLGMASCTLSCLCLSVLLLFLRQTVFGFLAFSLPHLPHPSLLAAFLPCLQHQPQTPACGLQQHDFFIGPGGTGGTGNPGETSIPSFFQAGRQHLAVGEVLCIWWWCLFILFYLFCLVGRRRRRQNRAGRAGRHLGGDY